MTFRRDSLKDPFSRHLGEPRCSLSFTEGSFVFDSEESKCVANFAASEGRRKAVQTVLLLSEERMLTLRLVGPLLSVN